jgi:Tfp pilus assembly ATPase PilU
VSIKDVLPSAVVDPFKLILRLKFESPGWFIHKDAKSIVSHREIGKQTESFASALKAALRDQVLFAKDSIFSRL